MPIEKAKSYYLGKGECARMNCAQSVACAFKESYGLNDDIVEAFRLYGGGNAPEGVCGAFYAVKYILEQSSSEKLKEFEKYFNTHAGALKCRDIKGLRKLSCIGCIEKSAEFLTGIK